MEPAKATAPKRPDPRQALADPSLPAAGSCRLRITIISAEGLKDADMTTRSDPFCVCKILTMDKPEFQTAVIKDNNNPVWNHRHVIVEYMPGDPLELKVYDHDEKAKPELLGVAQVASGTFFPNGLDKGELKLSGRGARGTLNVRIENLGSAAAFAAADRARREALLELRAAGPHRLRVSLLSASNLRDVDRFGQSDAFCSCRILPKEKPEFQTGVVEDCLNPVWNYEFELAEYLAGDPLELSVYDADKRDSEKKKLLGVVQLESICFFPEGLDREEYLTGKGAQGSLRLKIENLGSLSDIAAARAVEAAEVVLREAGPHRLRVTVLSARFLKDTDWVDKPHPFCSCRMRSKSNASACIEENGSVFIWNREHIVAEYLAGDMLELTAYDQDQLEWDDQPVSLFGRVQIASYRFFPAGLEEQELSFTGTGTQGKLKVHIQNLGLSAEFEAAQAAEKASIASLRAAGPNRIRVTLLSATGLKDADWIGKSDPFCSCRILPNTEPEFQTSVIKDSTSPVWNHEHIVAQYFAGDKLEFTIFDQDGGDSRVSLGQVELASSKFFPAGLEDELCLSGAGAKGKLKVRIENLGSSAEFEAAQAAEKAAIAALRAAGPHRLLVKVVSASGLKDAHWVGKPDPFCACRILPKQEPEFQTSVCKDSASPVWNHEHIVAEYFAGDPLELTVYDNYASPKPSVLGQVQIPWKTFFPAGLEQELQLVSSWPGSSLKVQIENLGSKAEFEATRAALRAAGPHKLRFTVISASGLKDADLLGSSDSFCSCRILPKEKPEFQTPVAVDQLDPVWNYAYVVPEYLAGDALELTVYDQDDGKIPDLLGRIHLSSTDFFPDGLEEELELGGIGATGKLKLKIESLGVAADLDAAQVTERAAVAGLEKGPEGDDADAPLEGEEAESGPGGEDVDALRQGKEQAEEQESWRKENKLRSRRG
ncbi:unnamed protein product [Polarella glacialis]|uniref:C2 domain-containing protein n=1 Tax=Polarella glacialis TaxID=89957 RepID=A0A813KYM8_POLGL|nr:unnamed protein product [Polarella glacialis]